MLCGSFRNLLLNEVAVNDSIQSIAEVENKRKEFRHELQNLIVDCKFTKPFSFALDSRIEIIDFILEKCKVMDSKKKPLWLSMKSAYEEDDINDKQSVEEIELD